jgi:heterodisulfide reductase subunit A-like polyferredoxin/coenzyme F420-reducing hydrogenase delta subunit
MNKKGVLVIGGGIAGIQAALDLADSGINVYLVERSPSLGGKMAQLDKTFPTNDCSLCILSPKLVTVARHPNIKIFTLSEVMSVGGNIGNFFVTVKKHPRFVNEDKCVGCGQCAERCPVKVPNEFDLDLSMRKAMYMPFPQAVPLSYTIDSTKCLYFGLRGKPIIDKKGRCMLCVKVCDAEAIDHEMKEEEVELNVGSIIVATGYELIDPSIRTEYGYGKFENVTTCLQLERLLNASGPSEGHVIRPSDHAVPKNIVFIQCYGSRDEHKGCKYCSRVCCMYAIKDAMIAKEHEPDIENITVCYIDIRAYGKDFEEYFERAKKEGIKFFRGRPAKIKEDMETKDLLIDIENTETGKREQLRANLLVLSSAMVPSHGTSELAKVLEIQTDETGFFQERQSNIGPIESTRDGIYLCGCAQGPKDIPDTVAQASAAAVKAAYSVKDYRVPEAQEVIQEKETSGAPRIGVFVCHCGVNIAGVVDVEAVSEYAKGLPGVVFSTHNQYTCSDDTQKKIQSAIAEHDLTRVIVAACTPRTHEPIFRETCEKSGLNPYLFEMANIRDQCSWVHKENPEAATEKSKDLLRRAVNRSSLLQPLQPEKVDVTKSALVIGGGIAGINSAIDISKQGFQTYLIEKTPFLGGWVAQRGLLSPEDVPASELLKENYEIMEQQNIDILTNTEVSEIDGFIGNFKVKLQKIPRGVDIEKCDACGKCVEACPIETSDRFNADLINRKAIYMNPNSWPEKYTIDFEHCDKCGKCLKVCEKNAINLEEESKSEDLDIGTIILAIGSTIFKPNGYYGYGEFPNVLSNVEFERLLTLFDTKVNSDFLINNKKPKTVALIHCVGSRETGGFTGCSRYCCQVALKHAIQFREMGVEVLSFYRDIRAFSKGTEDLYQKARALGVIFFRYSPEKPPIIRREGDQTFIRTHDKLFGRIVELPIDAVVLSVGMRPRTLDVSHLQNMLKIPLSENGFFLEQHPKLAPVETNTDGIYIAGCAQYPKNIADSIAQASGAAMKASVVMSKDELKTDPITSSIDQEVCIGCELCIELCPYQAIELNDEGKPEVIKVLCKGCGTCGASCPKKAITMRHFTDDQLFAQVVSSPVKIEGEVETGQESSQPEPNIVGILCNWCCYAGADLAGVNRAQYPPNIRVLRVMCSGRVDPIIVLEAFKNGADGVFIGGCHHGDCHYQKGNYQAERKIKITKKLLEEAGLEPGRLRIEWVSASEGGRFAQVMDEFTEQIKALGPSPVKTNKDLMEKLDAAQDEACDVRLRWLVGKERTLIEEGNVYGEKVPQVDFDEVINEALSSEFIRNRILNMTKEQPLSVKDMAGELDTNPKDILKQIIALRRKGLVELSEISGTSPMYKALPQEES